MTLLRLTLAAVILFGASPVIAGQRDDGIKVVELFTSQGCDTCPPADALIEELADRRDVLALSFHVDYWDYRGWSDPFAEPAFTRRQRDYAQALRARYVYTPQVVINGRLEAAGGQRDTVLALIDQTPPAAIVAHLTPAGPYRARVSLPETPGQGALTIWAVGFDELRETRIRGGDNAGQRLVNAHVVRELQYLGGWDGRAREFTVTLTRPCTGGIALLLQQPDAGAIVGAGVLYFNN